MKKLLLLFVILCSLGSLQAQEVYFYTGKNYTNYDYKSGFGLPNPSLQAGTGNFYEMGYVKPLKIKNLSYTIGLSLNEYNALGGNTANSYSWNTQYIGIQNGLVYSFLNYKDFNFVVKGGLGLSTLIYGKQELNGTYYDLSSQSEFSGLFIQPSLGLETKYKITQKAYLSLGYAYSKSAKISDTSGEKVAFNTNQIQFGLHFSIK